MTQIARVVALLLILGGGALLLGLSRFESDPPELAIDAPSAIGREGLTLRVETRDPGSGLRLLEVVLETAQGNRELMRLEAGPRGLFGPVEETGGEFEVPIDPTALGLAEGDVFLNVRVVDASWSGWFSGNETSQRLGLAVDLSAPRVAITNGLTYVQRAGSSAVHYTLGERAARDGVEVGESFFPGHPAPDAASPLERVALFAIPREGDRDPRITVVAEDAAGNQTRRSWDVRIRERRFAAIDVRLPERFFRNKVLDLAASLGVTADDPVAAFQQINTDVRAANEARIRELTASSDDTRHWAGAFLQLRNSKVTSRFAEDRTYLVDGTAVSEAIHYGYDLAALARSPIGAANAGRVAFAGDLGIYGACVIIDHGLGLASLYGHLSRIDVEPGDLVARGETLGLSGATGLAGGDHLHFAMLVSGTYVDPLEWWDPKWVREHVESRLSPPPIP